MRKLRIVVLFCIGIGFAVNKLEAQPAVTEKGVYSDGYYIDCAGEFATGNLMFHYVGNKNVYKFSWQGKLIGTESGTVYLIDDGGGQQLILNNEGVAWSFKWDYLVHANGKPIMRVKSHSHVTVNANGTLAVEFFRDEYECL